ncbi:MAG: hypothetical protein K5945_07765 [Bacteroidaceae bacterium]|nr:hypothetical protein [Bacteroidaceae bacterium]
MKIVCEKFGSVRNKSYLCNTKEGAAKTADGGSEKAKQTHLVTHPYTVFDEHFKDVKLAAANA